MILRRRTRRGAMKSLSILRRATSKLFSPPLLHIMHAFCFLLACESLCRVKGDHHCPTSTKEVSKAP